VRGGGDEQQVPVGVRGQSADQVVALSACLAAEPAIRDARVGFVDDDQVGTGAQKLVASPVGLDEVGRHDREREPFEDGLTADALAFQAADRARQHQFGLQAELGAQLAGPLLGQRRAAQHRKPAGVPDSQQFDCDEGRLDGLADADVIGDQQADGILPQGHQKGHELVGARLNGDPGK